jgi:hypothetical protein
MCLQLHRHELPSLMMPHGPAHAPSGSLTRNLVADNVTISCVCCSYSTQGEDTASGAEKYKSALACHAPTSSGSSAPQLLHPDASKSGARSRGTKHGSSSQLQLLFVLLRCSLMISSRNDCACSNAQTGAKLVAFVCHYAGVTCMRLSCAEYLICILMTSSACHALDSSH